MPPSCQNLNDKIQVKTPCGEFLATFLLNERSKIICRIPPAAPETPKANYYVPHGFWAINKPSSIEINFAIALNTLETNYNKINYISL